MSNLENLTEKILEEARMKAQAIVSDAEAFNDDVVTKKVREAEEKKVRLLEKAVFEANLLKERIVGNAEVSSRNEILKGKQKVIEMVFVEAKEKLRSLPKAEYLDFLQKSLSSLKLKGDEILVVTEEARDEVKTLGLKQKVSETESVESGFLVKDQKISLNFNFNDMVDFYRDELVKDVANSLFEE